MISRTDGMYLLIIAAAALLTPILVDALVPPVGLAWGLCGGL